MHHNFNLDAVKIVIAHLDKLAKSSWDLLMDIVRRGNSTKYQHYISTRGRKSQQELAEIIAGEMVGELKDSYQRTGGYERGLAILSKKWGVSNPDLNKVFFDPGAGLGRYVYDEELPPPKRKSLAEKIIEITKDMINLDDIKAKAREMVEQSKIRNKPIFLEVIQKARTRDDFEQSMYNLLLKFQGMPATPGLESSILVEGSLRGVVAWLDDQMPSAPPASPVNPSQQDVTHQDPLPEPQMDSGSEEVNEEPLSVIL